MTAGDIVAVPGVQFEETLASAGPDLLREMIRQFARQMMDADVEVRCGAGYGDVTPGRVNHRNGYRRRDWDTRAGTIELAIPRLRAGSYFPAFLGAPAPGRAGAGLGPDFRRTGRWSRRRTCWASRPGGWKSSLPPSA